MIRAKVPGLDQRARFADAMSLPLPPLAHLRMLDLSRQLPGPFCSTLLADLGADVLLEGFRPGVTARLGIDYDSVKALNGRLVYCSISGYGQDGPYRDRVGHDVNYLGYAGVLDVEGEAGGPPVIPGVQIADIGGGALMAAVGVPIKLSDTPASLRTPPAGFGEHTNAVLAELGLGGSDIEGLRARGIV